MKCKKGFTLIELLIVITIIGLISTIVISSLSAARVKARNAKRVSDINQLIKAIEMYYSDNGVYPTCTGANINYCTTTGAAAYGNLSTLQIVPTYIGSVPLDPLNINGEYGYYYARLYKPNTANSFIYTGNNTNYIIATRLENSSNPTFTGWNNSIGLNLLKGQ